MCFLATRLVGLLGAAPVLQALEFIKSHGRKSAGKSLDTSLSHMEYVYRDTSGEETYKVLMTMKEADVAMQMQPWQMLRKPRVPPGNGYLFFDTDPGGFNNIRMTFEFVLDVAKASNRTLVLPPQEGLYLIDWGPRSAHGNGYDEQGWIQGNGRSSYGDFWDIPDLQTKVDVITAQEFFDREHAILGIPPEAEPTRQSNNHVDGSRWKLWLCKTASLARGGCNTPVTVAMQDPDEAPLVHIPTYLFEEDFPRHIVRQEGSERRYLGCGSNSVTDLHYRPFFYRLASGPISSLGFRNYVAVHLRRNDFQFQQAPTSPEWLVELLVGIAEPEEAIYVASDEMDESWWASFRRTLFDNGHKIATFRDFEPELVRRGLNGKFSGVVEMIICAGAREFMGTRHSTFTQGIQLLRDDLKRVNKDWSEEEYTSTWTFAV